jgi:acyl-CoA synthetase (AMP-forming)/AMP-acid ligase II
MNGSANPGRSFWLLDHAPQSVALIDAHTGLQKAYGELRADVERTATSVAKREHKSLCLLLAQNRYECIVAYLAALQSGHALMMVDASLKRDLLVNLVATYQPEYIFSATTELKVPDYQRTSLGDPTSPAILERDSAPDNVVIHPSLGLLLSTSGSTGSPKFVRLTHENLQANATSIVQYLKPTSGERPVTSLPMAYSYGLSVINSHLLAGASLVLTEHGVLRREFWDSVDRYTCTSFSGVPYTYQMLLQTGLLKKRGAGLQTLTQAGGRLAEPLVRQMLELVNARGGKFFVMYGQTEATARMSYVPFGTLASKAGSIGVAVPGGSLHVDSASELVYSGPNVMMGYAESRADLAKGDELLGVLKTGDLARKDEDGYFYITGRSKRFLKMFGKRFNLDEVEQILQRQLEVPVACFGRDDFLQVAMEGKGDVDAVASRLREVLGLPKDAVSIVTMRQLPRTSNGKLDYLALASNSGDHETSVAQVAP